MLYSTTAVYWLVYITTVTTVVQFGMEYCTDTRSTTGCIVLYIVSKVVRCTVRILLSDDITAEKKKKRNITNSSNSNNKIQSVKTYIKQLLLIGTNNNIISNNSNKKQNEL